MIMLVQGHPLDDVPDHWPIVCEMKVLGHILSCDGSVNACFGETCKNMWRSFWMGSSDLRRFHNDLKLAALSRSVSPILRYRLTLWPY